jgi:uncharacterized protein YbjT (DUF2867 family)
MILITGASGNVGTELVKLLVARGVPFRAMAAYDCIKAFSKGAQLKTHRGMLHGMASTHHDVINATLLAFFKA